MTPPKTVVIKDDKTMHFSVGAVIRRGNKYLLIDRAQMPFGFAGIAGHIDEGEEPLEALRRELKEESNLALGDARLIFDEIRENNPCAKGITLHRWYLFECRVHGAIKRNLHETKSIGWDTKEEIKKLTLEPVWEYWFRKLKII